MTMEPTKSYAKKHAEKAEILLSDAELLLSKGRLISATDRAYYSMFYGVTAILVRLKIEPPKTHSGLRTVFGREVITKGLIDRLWGRKLTVAFKLRQLSTYEIEELLGEDQVKTLINDARQFLLIVKNTIESL